MKFKKLKEQLMKTGLCTSHTRNEEADIYSFHPLFFTKEYDPNMLYICGMDDIIRKEELQPLNFVCRIGSSDEKIDEEILALYPNSNFLLYQSENLDSIFELVSKIVIREMKHTSNITRLLEVYNNNHGLQSIVDELYKIIQSTIIIIDTSYRILAMSVSNVEDNYLDLNTQQELGYLTEQNLKRMKRDNIYEKLRATGKKWAYGKPTDSQHYWFDSLIHVNGIEMAEMGIIEFDHKFDDYDIELFMFFRQLVSREMEKGNFYAPNKGIMHSIFLSELLEEKFIDRNSIERRMRMLGWQKKNNYYILIAYSNESDNFQHRAEIFALQVQNALKNIRWVINKTHIVFLFGSETDNIQIFREDGVLSNLFLYNHMYGILSNAFCDLKDIKKQYDLVRSIHEFTHLQKRLKPIHFYAEYSFFHMAKIVSETHNLEDFYHPAALLIKKYDEENKTEYIKTLMEYLINFDNPTLCAENLCIHKNTFFYRMNRIRELFPVRLNYGIERMHLLLSLELMQLR